MEDQNDILLAKNINALNYIGMWPPKNKKYRWLYSIYSKLVLTWFVTFTTSEFIEMKNIYHDFKELTVNAGVSLLYGVQIAKVYIVLFRRKKVEGLVNVIRKTENEILSTDDEDLKKILNDYVAQNVNVYVRFGYLVLGTIVGFFINPLMQYWFLPREELLTNNGTSTGINKIPLIFSSWFPFNKYDPVSHYFYAFGFQLVSGTIGATYVGTWDILIFGLMIFGIGQFRILQYYLKNLVPSDHGYGGKTLTNAELYSRFKKCVIHHDLIIQYVNDLDGFINGVMLLDFIVCSLMLCATGLQATMEGSTVMLMFSIQYLVALLIQLFLFYWHANELTLEGLEVSAAAWDSRWYDCEQRIVKGLTLIMVRAQRPCILTAGRFYVMSLATFILILRASYSYLALLRQVYA